MLRIHDKVIVKRYYINPDLEGSTGTIETVYTDSLHEEYSYKVKIGSVALKGALFAKDLISKA